MIAADYGRVLLHGDPAADGAHRVGCGFLRVPLPGCSLLLQHERVRHRLAHRFRRRREVYHGEYVFFMLALSGRGKWPLSNF